MCIEKQKLSDDNELAKLEARRKFLKYELDKLGISDTRPQHEIRKALLERNINPENFFEKHEKLTNKASGATNKIIRK